MNCRKCGHNLAGVPRTGGHRLLAGDSTKPEDVARLMGGEKADLLVTDEPYGVSLSEKNRFLNVIAPANRIEIDVFVCVTDSVRWVSEHHVSHAPPH